MPKEKIAAIEIDKKLSTQKPQEILAYAIETYADVAISFSGSEDVVLIDMAVKIKPDIAIFCLDTGRLHTETYQFIERVRKHYSVDIDILFPDQDQVQAFVSQKGFFSFYEDGHHECCSIRKVNPLRKKLVSLDSWITGQRKDQSPNTRMHIPVIEQDSNFSRDNKPLVKFNPLSNWTSLEVWEYIRTENIPYNALHNKGFVSIGCEPCTQAIAPGQHEREGRWWWEQATKKECGLHANNIDAVK
jgi:phosphoadenosine phosphosulfate reductase